MDGKLKSKLAVSKVIRTIGQTMFIYGLLAWTYGVIISVIDVILCIDVLTFPVSHLFPWLSIGEVTIISFIVSMVGFLMWRIEKEE